MANEIMREITDHVGQEQDATAPQENQAQEQLDPRLAEIEREQTESLIPEKFVGKSAAEIARSYQELEKHAGKISSERAHEKKALEEAKERARLLEQQLQQAQTFHQQRATETPPAPAESDPFKPFDDMFEHDPKKAIRLGLERAKEEARREAIRGQYALQEQNQRIYYERMKKENPEFAEMEPEMVAIAQRFGQHLKPEVLRSPEVVDLMFSLAKGQNVSKIVARELEKAKKSGELVREEKRRAFSESSNSQGDKSRSFEDFSLEEMEKFLGKADR